MGFQVMLATPDANQVERLFAALAENGERSVRDQSGPGNSTTFQ